MATYNHEPFVAEAMQSVLSQKGVDFEFVIADDGSSDATRDVVSSVSDPRIRFMPNVVNRGACVVTNELIQASRGEYIALLNSDDAWVNDKLAAQVAFLDAHPEIGATFGRAAFVDRHGDPIPKESMWFGNVFDQPNRSRGMWLRHFFDLGNCICHPTMLIRRQVYETVGLYSNRLRQLPDLDMWVRVLKSYAIHVSEEPLIRFRILPGENASAENGPNARRVLNEHYLIAERFFDGMSREQLLEGFADVLQVPALPTDTHVRIEKVLQLMRPNQWMGAPYRMAGLGQLRALLEDAEAAAVLERDYSIDDRWFQARMAEHDVLLPRPVDPETLPRKLRLRKGVGLAWRALTQRSA